ncbi:MAG: gliding motility-associated C-terminal domain-containing protein, partial [Bacteroidota bacterium]
GSHEITLTYEQDNCTFTDNVVIDIFGIPDPSFEVTDTICVNNFATITYLGSASANAIYTWDFAGGNIISGNGSGPYDIQWADAGNYNITLTVEENGCTSTTFSENIQIDDELEVPIISCLSTTSTVTFSWADVVGATDYQVNELMGSGGVLNGNSYAFTNLSPGEAVSVEIVASGNTICGSSQSAAACSANDCPIIDLAIAPMADVCLGAQTSDLPLEVIVMGSDGSGVGEWSGNGVIGNNFDPQIAGVGSHEITYTFTEIQCVFSASVFINVFLQPVVDAGIGGTLTCDLTTITLNGTNSSSFGNVIWNTTDGNIVGNNNTLTPVVNAAGTYQLVVENSGCTASDEVTIIQDITLPVADAGTEKTITCTQNCVTIGGNNTSTGNDLTYLWTGGNNFTSNELTPTVCQAGDYQLVVYDNSNGCFSPPATVAVSENLTPPVATIESTGNLDCSTAGVILDASNSSATGGMTLQWRNDDGEILGVNNDTYEATTAGKYYLYVVDTINGCEAVDSTEIIDLTSYPLAAIEPAETLTCEVTSVVLDGSNSSSSNSIEYHWTGPQGGVQSGQNTPTPTVILSGEYHLNVLDTANGCATGASVLVFQNNTFPIVNAGQDIELNCNETTAELGNLNPSNSNQYTYQWTASNPDANISDPNAMQVTVEGFGTYTLEVTNIENGCTASDEVNVLESSNVPQIINVQFQDPTCYGDNDGFLMIESVEGGTPPYTYTFNGATESAQTFYNNLSPGDYDVTIRDFYGCELSTSTTLLEPELVTIDLGENQTIDLGDSITIQPWITGAYDTLIWTAPIPYSSCNNSFPCLNPTFQPTDIINVSATVLNENGCWAEDLITIFVRKNRKVFIPSAFAPAGHTENQKFMIYAGQGVKKINQFQVFNRWGEKLYGATEFLPNDASYGWDGNFNGKKMSPGVYVYFAEIEFIDGIKVIYKGDVTLMR